MSHFMKQGEIWLVSLDPTIGPELQKTRPAIIVNDNTLGRLPLKIIVPLTDWKDRYKIAPWMVKVEPDRTNQLTKTSAVDCFQIRSVSEQRCIRKIGEVDSSIMAKIRKALATALNIE
jgi:mRNA interferase MazF